MKRSSFFKVGGSIVALIGFLLVSGCINPTASPKTTETALHPNPALQLNSFAPAESTIRCDYLIITPPSFLKPALQLAEYRRIHEGDNVEAPLVVTTATLDSNYVTFFANEQETVVWKAIQSVAIAWKPTYIVLFGDARLKPRLYGGIPIPDSTLMGDLHYADIDLDNQPDICVGRIPVATVEEAENYVAKLQAFEQMPPAKMLTITDDDWKGTYPDYIRFSDIEQDIRAQLDSSKRYELPITNYRVASFASSDSLPLTSAQQVRANLALIDSLNTCNKLVTFLGHGSPQLLTDEHIITVYDVSQLTTTDIWISLGCNSNQYEYEDAFSKHLLRRTNAGAVAFIAPYYVGYSYSGSRFIKRLYWHLYDNEQILSLGEAFYATTKELHWRSNDGFFVFLGDPAIVL